MDKLVRGFVPFALCVGCCFLGSHDASGQSKRAVFEAEYRVTVAGKPRGAATLWLYYWGYQYFDEHRIGAISNGRMHVVMSAEQNEAAPDDSGLTRLVTLEVPGVGWYGPQEFQNAQDLPRAIERLGRVRVGVDHIRTLDLAPAIPQRVLLKNPDGTPRVNQHFTVWAFATSIGHCARTTGFGQIDLTTDNAGIARFRAPIGKKFLLAEHFDEKTGEKRDREALDSEVDHALRARWERRPERDFVFRIRHDDGSPAKAEVVAEGDGCDVSFRSFGKTDAQGDVTSRFS